MFCNPVSSRLPHETATSSVLNKNAKMGDLYPVIEGPVKFRDGKKVMAKSTPDFTHYFG